MGVEEGGFTRCGERQEVKPDQNGVAGRIDQKCVVYRRFFLTCRETDCNNDFCLAGGERGRRWVVKRCSAVNLPLEVQIKKNAN